MTIRGILHELLRWMMALLFITAGAIKAWQPEAFWQDVQSYRLLPEVLELAVVWYLPYLEIVCGVLLLPKRFRLEAALTLLGLMLIFMLALGISWARGLDITCGCFGGSGSANYPLLIFRDVLIAAAILRLISGCPKSVKANERKHA
ncbi:MAG: MauE/DoxX family redox-associated membrane protein [Verrucomicrobiota bacterium]